jgi:hypothetical protein
MIEGSGSGCGSESITLTNGSGSASRRPKKHADPVDPDLQHCYEVNNLVERNWHRLSKCKIE